MLFFVIFNWRGEDSVIPHFYSSEVFFSVYIFGRENQPPKVKQKYGNETCAWRDPTQFNPPRSQSPRHGPAECWLFVSGLFPLLLFFFFSYDQMILLYKVWLK